MALFKTSAPLCRLALVLVACLACVACGNPRVTAENYKKIKLDMTREQVEEILGPGKEVPQTDVAPPPRVGADKWLQWKNGKQSVYIGFSNADKIQTTQYTN